MLKYRVSHIKLSRVHEFSVAKPHEIPVLFTYLIQNFYALPALHRCC